MKKHVLASGARFKVSQTAHQTWSDIRYTNIQTRLIISTYVFCRSLMRINCYGDLIWVQEVNCNGFDVSFVFYRDRVSYRGNPLVHFFSRISSKYEPIIYNTTLVSLKEIQRRSGGISNHYHRSTVLPIINSKWRGSVILTSKPLKDTWLRPFSA